MNVIEQLRQLAESGVGMPMLLAALALATLASEDLACLAAGALVAAGVLAFVPASVACALGIFAGDLGLIALGRWLGRPALERWPLKGRVPEASLQRAERWFAGNRAVVMFASRFMPGTRLPTYVAAGLLRVPFASASLWLGVAVAMWTPVLVGVGALLGDAAAELLEGWGNGVAILLVALATVWAAVQLVRSLATWKGRRLLLGRWKRLVHWEYWPTWAVYPPVVLQSLVLGLRYRGFLVCTAANPGIPNAGGLKGESKSAILAGLAGAGTRVARWRLIAKGSLEARRATLEAFLSEGSGVPVVLKPDVGERGSGVVIARTVDAAVTKLEGDASALIAQEYVPGIEFGVFYVREPGKPRGRIFAITEKRTTHVTGDGVSSIERLILEDTRAVAMAPYFLREFAERIGEIPPAGQRVELAELGTHCRGALFLDGMHHLTPELEEAVESVSRTFEGFHFGRYDVRTPDVEAFRRGEFTVIELNGLSSEATSIYDPRHSILHGWRVLMRQWRIAYAIGAANRDAGAKVWTYREIREVLRN